MKKRRNQHLLGTVVVCGGTFVLLTNYFMVDISQSWQLVTYMLSIVVSVVIAILCLYAIGFTTIRMSLIAIGILPLVLCVWIDNLPAKLRFKAAKEELASVLADIKEGEQIETPLWIGTFHVKKIKQMNSGETRFWIVEHPHGNTGLVYSPVGRPQVNDLMQFELDNNWYFVSVD